MKKAVRTSLRFTPLNEDAYTRSTVYRDNEDLRAKVSRETLAASLRVLSRDKAEKQKLEEEPRSAKKLRAARVRW